MKIRDMMRAAFRAKDAEELEGLEKRLQGEGVDPDKDLEDVHGEEDPGRTDDLHLHIHRGSPMGEDDDDPDADPDPNPEPDAGGGDDDEALATRLEALERDMEEMKAQHEEMNDLLEDLADEGSEDSRRRMIKDFRDGRHKDSRHKDKREDSRMADARKKKHADARGKARMLRRAHDADSDKEGNEWKEEEKALDAIEHDLDHEDCAMDALDRHHAAMDKMRDARDRRTKDDEAEAAAKRELENALEFEAPPGTGDKARKARDSAYLEDSWQDTVAMAEILAPGIRYPTFDKASAPANSLKKIEELRKEALDLAYNKAEMRGNIDDAVGGSYIDRKRTLDCGEMRTLFRAMAALQRSKNNAGQQHFVGFTADRGAGGGTGALRGLTPEKLNQKNAEFWAKQRA